MPTYVCGRGDDGQLGLQQAKDTPFTIVPSLCDKRILNCVTGSGHTIFLSDDSNGSVYSCGRGDDGRLGHGTTDWKYEPKRVEYFHTHGIPIASIACGSYHSAAISTNGELFTWGGSLFGKLGHGNEAPCLVPQLVRALSPYANAQAKNNGSSSSSGGNSSSSTSNESSSSGCSSSGGRVIAVACGSRHTVALLENGDLYSWGDPSNGVLGLGPNPASAASASASSSAPPAPSTFVTSPALIKSLRGADVVAIAACGAHTLALTMRGRVYSFGAGLYGRCGHGNEDDVWVPRELAALRPSALSESTTMSGKSVSGSGGNLLVNDSFETSRSIVKVVSISAGGFHSSCTTSTGAVYCWGGGEHGQLGLGVVGNSFLPTLVQNLPPISSVSCGWSHTLFLPFQPSEGIYATGNADHFKIPTASLKPVVAQSMKGLPVTAIATYNEHCVVLTAPCGRSGPFDIRSGLSSSNSNNSEAMMKMGRSSNSSGGITTSASASKASSLLRSSGLLMSPMASSGSGGGGSNNGAASFNSTFESSSTNQYSTFSRSSPLLSSSSSPSLRIGIPGVHQQQQQMPSLFLPNVTTAASSGNSIYRSVRSGEGSSPFTSPPRNVSSSSSSSAVSFSAGRPHRLANVHASSSSSENSSIGGIQAGQQQQLQQQSGMNSINYHSSSSNNNNNSSSFASAGAGGMMSPTTRLSFSSLHGGNAGPTTSFLFDMHSLMNNAAAFPDVVVQIIAMSSDIDIGLSGSNYNDQNVDEGEVLQVHKAAHMERRRIEGDATLDGGEGKEEEEEAMMVGGRGSSASADGATVASYYNEQGRGEGAYSTTSHPMMTSMNTDIDVFSSRSGHHEGPLLAPPASSSPEPVATFYAHRAILSIRCPAFAAMLRADMRESAEKVLQISDTTPDVVLAFLHFIYTDTLAPDLDNPTLVELWTFADRFLVDRLTRLCEARVIREMTTLNAAMIFVLADAWDIPRLRRACLKFIVSSSSTFDAIVKTQDFAEMEKGLILEILSAKSTAGSTSSGSGSGGNDGTLVAR